MSDFTDICGHLTLNHYNSYYPNHFLLKRRCYLKLFYKEIPKKKSFIKKISRIRVIFNLID